MSIHAHLHKQSTKTRNLFSSTKNHNFHINIHQHMWTKQCQFRRMPSVASPTPRRHGCLMQNQKDHFHRLPNGSIRNMSPKDVAAFLGICARTATELMRLGAANGGIACSDISVSSGRNRRLRTSELDVQTWLSSREVGEVQEQSRKAARSSRDAWDPLTVLD